MVSISHGLLKLSLHLSIFSQHLCTHLSKLRPPLLGQPDPTAARFAQPALPSLHLPNQPQAL